MNSRYEIRNEKTFHLTCSQKRIKTVRKLCPENFDHGTLRKSEILLFPSHTQSKFCTVSVINHLRLICLRNISLSSLRILPLPPLFDNPMCTIMLSTASGGVASSRSCVQPHTNTPVPRRSSQPHPHPPPPKNGEKPYRVRRIWYRQRPHAPLRRRIICPWSGVRRCPYRPLDCRRPSYLSAFRNKEEE